MWSNYIKDIKILWGAYFNFFLKGLTLFQIVCMWQGTLLRADVPPQDL